MTLCTDSHGPQRMRTNVFGDPLTFPSSAIMRPNFTENLICMYIVIMLMLVLTSKYSH